jgi:hypothetical protein
MLNGKFVSYKLKANLYINLGNADLFFFAKTLSSFNNQTRSSSSPISCVTNLISSSRGLKPQLYH